MANKKYPKIKPITIAVQKHKMRALFKEIIIKDFRGTGLKMILRVQPTQYSKSYRVLIEYSSLQTKPKVYISEEELNVDDLEDIPHTYGIKEEGRMRYVSLCLYYKNEWNSLMSISDTIVPWICEWLYYYEIWLITGSWCGGGKHPSSKDIKENDKY